MADVRFWAERAARKKATDAGLSPEIDFAAINGQIKDALDLNSQEAQNIADIELDIESHLLVAHPRVLRWYRHARAAGKKVIFVSDMYLPADFLTNVLVRAGYEDPHVFVSNVFTAGKWETQLFHEVARQIDIRPDRFLHVGDNAQSDKQNADAAGWVGLHFTESEQEQPYALQLVNNSGLDIGSVAVSVGLGLSRVHRLQTESQDASFIDRFAKNLGYEVIGPTVTAFAGWIAHQVQADNVDRVLFLARDSFLPQAIYEMLRKINMNLPESRYVVASWRMLYSAMFSSIKEIEDFASNSIGFSQDTTFSEYFDIFLFSQEEIGFCAKKFNIADIHAPLLQQLSQVRDFSEAQRNLNKIIKEIAPDILDKANKEYELRTEYYKKMEI